MPKCSLKNRILQLRISTCVFWILCLITVIHFFTFYGKYNYSHLSIDKLQNELYKEVTPNLILKKSNFDCKYDDIIKSIDTKNSWDVRKRSDVFSPNGLVNGSFVPEHCNPLFSVAVLVTYRNRQKQLDIFLPYIHNFLRKQNIHYRIYLIEQQDEKPWNKGMLYNIGAKQAMADKFPCLILHDVDLLPLDDSNLYACTMHPRHMSASIDKFRYVLPYDTLVGGVLAIRSDQYKSLNGFSNKFKGWGGEDDDFAGRLAAHELSILRFPQAMSRYTMLVHHQELKNENRLRIMAENQHSAGEDGLNSIRYSTMVVKPNKMFTLIGVKL